MNTRTLVLAGICGLAPACATLTPVTTVTTATPTNGGATVTSDAAVPLENLKTLNERVNIARKSLLQRFGDDPVREAATIATVGKELAAVRAQITPLKSNAAAYEAVSENLFDAEKWNATTQAGLRAQLALKAMEKRALEDPPPSARDLDVTERTVKAFTTNVRKEWKVVAGTHTQRMSDLRRTVAEAQARAAAKEREEAHRQAEKAIAEVKQRIAALEVPSEEEISALAALVERVDAVSSPEAREGRRLLLDARIARALAGDRPAPVLQNLFLADAVTDGQSTGKALSVPLTVKKGHCLVWVGRYTSYTGSERVREQKVVVAGDSSAAQQFSYGAERVGTGGDARAFELRGVCATRDLQATLTGKLEFTGTRNSLRYAALDFEKSHFPRELASSLVIDMPDHCDPDAWAAMYLSPIPGSFGYLRGEPVVVSCDRAFYAAEPGQYSIGHREEDLSRAPPDALNFTRRVKWSRCDPNGAAPASRALRACTDRIERRYESQWQAIDRVREVASAISTSALQVHSPATEEQAARLRKKFDDDFVRECQPLEDTAQKAFEARFGELMDQLTDTRPVDILYPAGP